MENTLSSTFDKLLAAHDAPKPKECHDCGATGYLEILFTSESGNRTWICQDCSEKREEKQRAYTAKKRDQLRELVWRNNWEE